MRFKSVFGAFFFIIVASLIALLVFVQTKSFGHLLTKVLSDLGEKKTQTRISIKNIEVTLFPPGIEFHKVSIKKRFSATESFNAQFGKLGFYISLIEIEEQKLTFGEIRIADSVIDYTYPKKEEELKEIDQKLINKIFALSDDMPVRIDTILVENSLIRANHDLLEAKRLKLFKKGESFIARFHLANIKPSAESDFSLDEIWGDAQITKKNINIYRLKIQHDVQTMLVKGKIINYPRLKNAHGQLNGEAHIHLSNLKSQLNMPEMIKIKSGHAHLNFNVQLEKMKISGDSRLSLQDLRSNVLYADNLDAKVSFQDKDIRLDELQMIYKDEKIKLIEPAVVAHLNNKEFLTTPLKVNVENFSLSNSLRFLGPKFKVLKGKLNGNLSFVYDKGDFFLNPADGFYIENLALVVGEKKKPFTILKINKTVFKEAEIAVVNGEFRLSTMADLGRSLLEIDGFVNSKEVRFSVLDAKVNLLDFGNISNLDVKGDGRLSINVTGPLSDVDINLKGKTKGFEILGYRLGETEKDITIALKDSSVIIHKMESLYHSTPLSGSGVVNYDNSDIALGINSPSTNFADLSQILHPIFSKLDFLPEDMNFSAKVDVNIFGKTKLDQLRIKSEVNFNDLTAYGENLNSGSFNVTMEKQVVSIMNLDAKKDKGDINGDFSFAIPTKAMKVNYRWENLVLSSFHFSKLVNLNVDGQISGTLVGEGTTNNYVMNLKTKMFNTRSQSHKFDDSEVDLKMTPSNIKGDVHLFGSSLYSKFDISLKSGKKSDVLLKANIPNIKPLLVAFFGQHLESESLSGRFALDVDAHFSPKLHDLDLKASLTEMVFDHPDFKVNYRSENPELLVKNGHISHWDINIKQPDLFLVTKGSGQIGNHISLVHEFNLNSKLIEILIQPILSSEGFLRNLVKVESQNDNYYMTATSKAQDLNLSIESMPFPLNNLTYDLEYSDKRLLIKELSTSLDNGSVGIKGDIFFDDSEPDVNIRYILDRAEIPILGKSSINLTGDGTILGNNMPYVVTGEIVLNKALIVNELSDFDSKSSSMAQVRYLPKNQESPIGKLLALNINVKSENTIRISNSLMDIGLRGEVRVTGSPTRPRGEGRLFSPIGASRVFFKNNEYLITNADLNFSPKKQISNPDFDIQAMTLISSYKVYAKAYGDLERFNFDLTSDPALPRNSILSLIAFGYTDEIQNSLDQRQRDNLTSVGVGSFVFDRFKISDILNKQFGLQVNLGTVIEQSQTSSMLAGRTQDSQGAGSALSKTRSATKIELKKRLDEALSLSVSSTMGGTIGQRQRMDLTYSVNRRVQLQGIYELRTNADGEEDIIDNSIGGDLKFRWSFK